MWHSNIFGSLANSFLLGLERVSNRKLILGFWFAHRKFRCRLVGFLKNKFGIWMGRALKKFNSLGNTIIFKIDALPNQEKCLKVHFLKSVSILFSRGLKLASNREFVSDVSLIPEVFKGFMFLFVWAVQLC